MARHRWTLALFLFCPLILATVITAFRVRDLPKTDRSVNIEGKQKCDNCDVKFSSASHSIKTESDKHTYEDLKKSVREKQQQTHQNSEAIFSLSFEDSYEEDDYLNSLKVRAGITKTKKEDNGKKLLKVNFNDEDNSSEISISSTKKNLLAKNKPNQELNNSKKKDTLSKLVNLDEKNNVIDYKDDNIQHIAAKPIVLMKQKDDYKTKDTEGKVKKFKPLIKIDSIDGSSSNKDGIKRHDVNKPTLLEIKKTNSIVKPDSKNEEFSDARHIPKKRRVGQYDSDELDSSNYDGDSDDGYNDDDNDDNDIDDDDNDDDDDDEDDDEDDDDDDEDDDGMLSSLWETFSMLGLNIDPSLKPDSKNEKEGNPVSVQKQESKEDNNKDKQMLENKFLPKIKDTKNTLKLNSALPKPKETTLKESLYRISDEEEDDDNDDDDDDDDYQDDDMNNRLSKKLEKMIVNKTITKEKASIIPTSKKVIVTKSAYVNNDEDNDNDDDIINDNSSYEKKKLHQEGKDRNISKKKDVIYSSSKKTSKPKSDIDNEENNYDNENKVNHTYSSTTLTRELRTKINTKEKEESPLDTNTFKGKPDFNKHKDNDDSIITHANLTIKLNTSSKSSKQEYKNNEVSPLQTKDSNDIKNNEDTETDKLSKKPVVKPNLHVKIDKDVKPREEDNQKNNFIKDNLNKPTKKENKDGIKTLELIEKDMKNMNKEVTSTDIKEKFHHEKPKKEEKKTISSSKETIYHTEEGLNIPEIKKEIKAQIRSSRENKDSDKKSKQKGHDSSEKTSSTENHLNHLTDALHRRNLLKSEFEDFYAFFPTFAPNFSRIHNPECRRHGQIVLRQLRGTKLWALNMLDATAKIPSGILQGNGIQLGDFDQCIQSRARVRLEGGSIVKVQGKYCLARVDVKAEHPELEAPVNLALAKNLIRSRIDDPGHFVPRFSTLSWGICLPDVCNPEDVEVVIKDAIKHYQKISGVIVRVKVDEQDCHIKETDWWKDWIEMPTVLTLSFYGISILLVLVATLQDYFATRTDAGEEIKENTEVISETGTAKVEFSVDKQSDGFISSFSLYRTIDKLLAPGTTDDISCIHGIRAIGTIALLIAHKFLPVAGIPYTNRLKITEVVSSPLWSWCRAGWMFTDCFLLISGALTAHKSSDNDNGALKRLFSKYLRLTPGLLAVVLFYAYVWDNISNGPMWGTYVTKNSQICREGWWWNLFYVQNYFGLEDMCAPQTHQLALDMQLTIVGVILLWVMQMQGVYRFILPALHIIAAYSRYTTVRDHRLTMLAYHGVSVSQLYRTARLSYTSVLHRSTAYLVGISLGLALKNPPEHGKFLLGVGWLSSTALWCLVWWAGADSGSTDYRYQVSFAAQYAALAPVASALAIAWVIYAVHSGGNSGFLTSFLCCRPLVLISRLSYAIYLTQFIVFITNIGTVKTSSEFTLMSLIDIQEILAILLCSVILTLTFVIPLQSLHKFIVFPTISESIRKNSRESLERVEDNHEKEQKKENHKLKETNNVEPQVKFRQHLIAHREILEEIPETEVEYESQRDNERLGEILEEEEDDDMGEESVGNLDIDDDLEIIEEEEGGEDDMEESLLNRRQYTPRRSYSNEDEQDLNEWEWTSNSSRNGAQSYRYSR